MNGEKSTGHSVIRNSVIRNFSRGFTLIELLVVIAMLAILMGAMTSSVSSSRRRSLIAKATQDVKEITNAILAYQNYAPNRSLEQDAKGSWQPATEGNLDMILGERSLGGNDGQEAAKVPVLYNAQIKAGAIRDPWGQPYEFMIKKVQEQDDGGTKFKYFTAPSLPNYHRLTDEEKQ